MIILIIVTCRIDEHPPMRKWKETKKEKEKKRCINFLSKKADLEVNPAWSARNTDSIQASFLSNCA